MYKLTEAKFRDNKEVFRNPNIGTIVSYSQVMTKMSAYTGGTATLENEINDFSENRVIEYFAENTPNRAYYYTHSNTGYASCGSELSGSSTPDLTLVPSINSSTGDSNMLYVGEATANCSYKKPSCIRVKLATKGVGTWTGVWEYYNGSAWVALPCTDRTAGFTKRQERSINCEFVEYVAPSDWGACEVDGYSRYWLRYRITSVTSVTTNPVIAQIHFIFASQGKATVGAGGTALSLPLTVTHGPNPASGSRVVRNTRTGMGCFVYLKWDRVEATRGTINFYEPLNDNYCGYLYMKMFTTGRFVYRFVMDYPNDLTSDNLPAWLKGESYLNGNYTAYLDYGGGTYPNYDNPILISEHSRVLSLLATEILADSRTYAIQIGSVGHWGELHHHSNITYFPAESVMNQYFQHYFDIFYGKIHLTCRRAYEALRGKTSGHNDYFGSNYQMYRPSYMGSIPGWQSGYEDIWGTDIELTAPLDYYNVGPAMGEPGTYPDSGDYSGFTLAKCWGAASGGTVYTDETTDVNDSDSDDVAASPMGAQDDAIYFGSDKPFPALYVDMSTNGSYVATMVWEYYNGSSWATLAVTDGTATSSKPFSKDGLVSWYEPKDWALTSVNSESSKYYYVRCRASAYTSATTPPKIKYAYIYSSSSRDNFSQTWYPSLFQQMKDYKLSIFGAGGDCGAAMLNGVNNSNQMISRIGYRIFTNRAKLSAMTQTITNGSEVQLSLGIRNRGFAKFYDDWTVELTLIDSEDAVVQTITPSLKSTDIEVGENYFVEDFTIGVSAGTYSMAIAIIDPLTNLPGVRFAQTARNDNRHVFLTGIVVS